MFGLRRLQNEIGRVRLERSARRPYDVAWRDAPLRVDPGVLNPVATRVGAWLAGQVDPQPGTRWVDMGCGTGIVGLSLAAAGARVTAVDVDPRCVANTRFNAARRGVTLEVVQSDHFAALGARRFDGVAYNVPFWPGEPGAGPFDRSFYAGGDFELIRAFAGEARRRAPVVLVALSEAGLRHEEAVAALGPAERTRRDRVGGEWLTLWRLLA